MKRAHGLLRLLGRVDDNAGKLDNLRREVVATGIDTRRFHIDDAIVAIRLFGVVVVVDINK